MGKIKFEVVVFLLLAAAVNAKSQVSCSFTSYFIKDNNVYEGRDTYETLMNASALQLGYGYSGQAFRFRSYYTVNANQYTENSVFNSASHQILLKSSWDLKDNVIQLNGLYKGRNYNKEIDYYDIDRFQVNAQIQNSPSLQKIGTAGLMIRKDQYGEFADLDNLVYELHGQYQYFFQRGISLSLKGRWGVKEYVNQTIVNNYGLIETLFAGNRTVKEAVKASQLNASCKIGKSLTAKTGMSLEAGGQWFVGEPIASYTGGIYYYTENDLYDDPYAYQGLFAELQLTRQFQIGFQVKGGMRFQSKDYAGTPALDEDGELLGKTRRDSRNSYYLLINKKINTQWQIPQTIELFFNFIYRQNPSNDPYYDFEDQIGLMGFSLGF